MTVSSPPKIDGKKQVARWYECSDGTYCLELIVAGLKHAVQRKYFERDQVTNLRQELEVRGIEEAKKLWPHAR